MTFRTVMLLAIVWCVAACSNQADTDSRTAEEPSAAVSPPESSSPSASERPASKGSESTPLSAASPPEPAGRPPSRPGTYSGELPDGSRFKVTLVADGDGVRASQAGYAFVATGIDVDRVYPKDSASLGALQNGRLTFAIPILLKFGFSTSLVSEQGGSVNLAYYEVALSEGEGDPTNLKCSLKKSLSPDKRYEGKFDMADIGFKPGKGDLLDEYVLNLNAVDEAR